MSPSKWKQESSYFGRLKSRADVSFVAERLSESNASALADADIISPFVYSELGRRTLEQISSLKLLAMRSIGYDHVDISYYRNRGIVVSNVPIYVENTVAEHAFALLLHALIMALSSAKVAAADLDILPEEPLIREEAELISSIYEE